MMFLRFRSKFQRENGTNPENLILDSDDDVFNKQGPSTSAVDIARENPITRTQTLDSNQPKQKIKQKKKKAAVRRNEMSSGSSSSLEIKSKPKSRPMTGFRPRTAKKKSEGEDLEKTVESIIASVQKTTVETVDETKPLQQKRPSLVRSLVFSPPESFEVERQQPTITVEEPSQSNSITEEVERSLINESIDIAPLTPREQLDILLDIDRSAEKTSTSEDSEEPKESNENNEPIVEEGRKIFAARTSIEIVEPSDESLPSTPRARGSFLLV